MFVKLFQIDQDTKSVTSEDYGIKCDYCQRLFLIESENELPDGFISVKSKYTYIRSLNHYCRTCSLLK